MTPVSLLESWREEMQSAFLYRIVAQAEEAQAIRTLFLSLADAAEEQAQILANKLQQAGQATPADFRVPLRTRVVAWLVRLLGPRRIRPVLAAMKIRGLSVYTSSGLRLGHPTPTSVEEVGARHKGMESGGNLRAAVFGINDGLVSNTSLIMGIAGATGDPEIITLTGIAGMLAGAFSMAAGEYVSVRSQRELYEYQIGLEREELVQYPEEEAEELALIYNARGVSMEQARQLAHSIIQDPDHALATLSREELGLNPDELGSPWGAALSSFLAFSMGGVIPLLPFLYGQAETATRSAAFVAALSLFAVGAALSLFTGRNALFSGLRMVAIGGVAGLVTHLIGRLLGVSLA